MDITKIMLIDANEFDRITLRILLTAYYESTFQIVLEESTLNGISRHKSYGEYPDVILLDINIPSANRLKELSSLKSTFPKSQVIIITDEKNLITARRCIELGVQGYVKKRINQQELIYVIKQVVAGGACFDPVLTKTFFVQIREKKEILRKLTPREQNIVQGIANGLSYKLIADKYQISIDTVREHIKKLYRKLNINSKGELLVIVKF